MPARPWLAIAASVSIALAPSCGSGRRDATPAPEPFVDTELDEFGIALLPTPEDLARVTDVYPDRPVVMVNLLHFHERAIALDGDLSGEEAYRIYADGVIREVGGRVLWAGRVDAQVVGSREPRFDEIALVEYPSGAAFFSTATDPQTLEVLSYRSAGLEGQWLLASTTEIEGVGPFDNPPDSQVPSADDSRDDLETRSRATGLSNDQLERLLDGPADEPVDIVELLRFAGAADGGSGREGYERYTASLDRVAAAGGAWSAGKAPVTSSCSASDRLCSTVSSSPGIRPAEPTSTYWRTPSWPRRRDTGQAHSKHTGSMRPRKMSGCERSASEEARTRCSGGRPPDRGRRVRVPAAHHAGARAPAGDGA